MSNFPNILLVFSDQHRSCDLGCYGNAEVSTPHFDAFAKNSAVFTNCISNSPLCVPARGCLMTGLMPNNHRAISNDLPIDSNAQSIATVMNQNGYHTGYIGKWHLGGIPRDKAIKKEDRLGFTEWKVCNCNHDYYKGFYFDEENIRHEIDGYEPVAQTDMAIDFISRQDSENPWGLVLSYSPPHDPYFNVPEQYLNLYRDRVLTLRPNVPDTIFAKKNDIRTKEQIAKYLKGYYAHITALDEQFARILDVLETSGQMENTIVVYTADHGDMLGSNGYLNKQLPYEEAIKVPLMVYQKGKTVPTISDEILSLVDLPVSLLALAGIQFNEKRDGKDLHHLFTQHTAKGLECAYLCDLIPCHQAYDRGSPEWRGIKTARYTYARSYDNSFNVLFDNISDPFQLNNLSSITELRNPLEDLLLQMVRSYDEFLPWDRFLIKNQYLNEWNKSQTYFNLPILVE